MSTHEAEQEHKESRILKALEIGDGFAHLAVSALLLLLAITVLVFSTVAFVLAIAQDPTPREFAKKAITYLADLLLGVIVLELLSTILTYIKAHKLEATIKDFLIVAFISCVRKVLLVGAQSSTEPMTHDAFIKESIGTIITIAAAVLLIGALLFLNRKPKTADD